MLLRISLAIAAAVLLLPACAQWDKTHADLELPAAKLRPDMLVCEIAFVQWDLHETDSDQRFWQSIDEQFLPPELRRRLAENGLRVGVISGQLPEEVRTKLGEHDDPVVALLSPTLAPGTEMLSRRETRQCRDGVAEKIEVLPQRSQTTTVLLNDQGLARGEQFEKASGFIELESQSHAGGLMHIQLTPGIEHGELRPRLLMNQGGSRLDHRREQRLFSELSVATQLANGQVLVITSTPDVKGLGAAFFANRFSSSTEQLFLLIRLSRGQGEELFTPDNKLGPLATQRTE